MLVPSSTLPRRFVILAKTALLQLTMSFQLRCVKAEQHCVDYQLGKFSQSSSSVVIVALSSVCNNPYFLTFRISTFKSKSPA